jgi:osmotically-inducible protein OsmY
MEISMGRSRLRRLWPVIGLIGLMACGRGRDGGRASSADAAGGHMESRQRTLNDVTTELEVRVALLDRLGVDGLGVEVLNAGGEVTLTGAVDRPRSVVLADEAVSALPGVSTVHNRLSLAPAGERRRNEAGGRLDRELADELLGARVRLRLYSEVGLDASTIGVIARGGSVTLTGTIPTPQRHIAAVTTAETTEGCREVVDEIRSLRER